MQFIQLLLIASGLFITISSYGFLYLLAYAPISLLWGFFWGLPPLIGTMKVSDTFAPGEFWGTVFAQLLLIFLLLKLVEILGVGQILPIIISVGLLTGLMMPASSLRAEREEMKAKSQDN